MSQTDPRARVLMLTEAGWKRIAEVAPSVERVQAELLAPLAATNAQARRSGRKAKLRRKISAGGV